MNTTMNYFAIIVLNNESCIVDTINYYASEERLTIQSVDMSTGPRKIKLNGSGWVVLSLSVPLEQVRKILLNAEKLCVYDNNDLVVFRRGKIDHRSEKVMVGTISECTLQVFEGTGEIWTCPTL